MAVGTVGTIIKHKDCFYAMSENEEVLGGPYTIKEEATRRLSFLRKIRRTEEARQSKIIYK